ncbi:MAG: glycoside hydrolase family 10 protein [Cyanobacteria bacterium P01_D01_bin.71]
MKQLRYLAVAGLTALLLCIHQGQLGAIPFNGTGSEGPTPAAPTGSGASEIRGVWLTNVDSAVLFSRAAVEQTLQQLANYRFNTIYPTVWSWGYTLYPSSVAAQAIGYSQGLYPDFDATGRNVAWENAQSDHDALQEVITSAHAHNLSVIPWFEFGFMAPAVSPLAQRHPNWLTQKQGNLPEARFHQEGEHTRVWLNPFHPEVQQFLLELIGELMENYEVDGLQLDDHFSLPVEFGYDPYTVSLYRQEHDGRWPPTNPRNAEWMRWRADKITAFVGRVFQVIKARRPTAILSVSPNPAHFAYGRFLQDWPRWQQIGYVEELIVQVYRDNLDTFRQTLRDREIQRSRDHIPTGVGIMAGLRHQPVSMSLIQQQVQAARDMGFDGVSFFFYETLWQLAPGETMADRTGTLRQLFGRSRSRAQI